MVFYKVRGCRSGRKIQRNIQVQITSRHRQCLSQSHYRKFPCNLHPIHITNSTQLPLPSILLSNVRSMKNKIDDLNSSLLVNKCDIAVITETWLQDNIPSGSLDIPGYDLFRNDRIRRVGGGVAAYIRSDIKTERLSSCMTQILRFFG